MNTDQYYNVNKRQKDIQRLTSDSEDKVFEKKGHKKVMGPNQALMLAILGGIGIGVFLTTMLTSNPSTKRSRELSRKYQELQELQQVNASLEAERKRFNDVNVDSNLSKSFCEIEARKPIFDNICWHTNGVFTLANVRLGQTSLHGISGFFGIAYHHDVNSRQDRLEIRDGNEIVIGKLNPKDKHSNMLLVFEYKDRCYEIVINTSWTIEIYGRTLPPKYDEKHVHRNRTFSDGCTFWFRDVHSHSRYISKFLLGSEDEWMTVYQNKNNEVCVIFNSKTSK